MTHLYSANKFLVGVDGQGSIVVLNAPLQATYSTDHEPGDDHVPTWPAIAPLSSDEALNLAAWLVAVTARRAEFDLLLASILAT